MAALFPLWGQKLISGINYHLSELSYTVMGELISLSSSDWLVRGVFFWGSWGDKFFPPSRSYVRG